MKKFSTPIQILLALGCLVALGSWRSARSSLQTMTNDFLTTSNKLTEITAQLVTKAATVETLRITQNLHATDLITCSNRLGGLVAELDQLSQATRQTTETLRFRVSELAVARAEIERLQQTSAQLLAESRAGQAQLADAGKKLQGEQQHAATLLAAINDLRADTARLQQLWNDPASLRAQLTHADRARPVDDAVRSPAKSTKLVMTADGSVTAVPATFEVMPAPGAPLR